MLLNLHVKNFALIDDCEVEFENGLNILTGETGAGKSIIIDSINTALGARASKDVIRQDGTPASIELVFSTDDSKVGDALKDMDIPSDDSLIISRKITSSRNVFKINGETVTAAQVKRIAELLIDIHGQHEHQSLLSPAKHLEILDEYGREEISPLKTDVAALYRDYTKVKEELSNSSMDDETRRKEMAFLEYEIKEIEDAALRPGEDEELEADYRKLSNGKRITEALDKVYDITGRGTQERNVGDSLGDAVRRLSSVTEYDESLEGLLESLEQIEVLTSDFNRELSAYLSDNEFGEEELNATERRLDLINNLKAKYGNTIEDIGRALESRKEKLSALSNLEDHLAGLENKYKKIEGELDATSKKLSAIRRLKAKDLEVKIKEGLSDLNFLQAEFEIAFTDKPYSGNGADEVHFLISTNPGEPLRELSAVASGGELSRIMLAIKTIMARSDAIPTLIFDEIDAGISGRTAQKVSEKLSLVSSGHQVICITHLPQIASMADNHYLIEKKVEGAQTITSIALLSYDDSVTEIARMLGGAKITEAVIANAKEMKQMAASTKE